MKRILSFCCMLGLAAAAIATPPNVPILDGKPIDYDAGDLRATFGAAPTWSTVTVSNLFVTWDATHLYVGYQAWLQSDKVVVILDADPGAGTGATTTTNWIGYEEGFPGHIKYNEFGWVETAGNFGLDYMLASEGTYNNVIRVLYDGTAFSDTNDIVAIFDVGNGNGRTGRPLDMTCERNATLCPHQGIEAQIPWAEFYGASNRFGTVEPGEIVPRGAKIRLLAGVHNNTPNDVYSSPDTLPRQTGGAWADGILTNPEYVDVLLDVDSNGIPDVLTGDHNAPWIRAASGSVGGTNIYVAFSEPVVPATAGNPAYWMLGGVAPSSAVALRSNLVLLGMATPIASTDLLPIVANGVEDVSGNSREVEHCLFPAASGTPLPVTVTFQVNTNSGMGVSSSHAKPAAFFVNGAALPLEWGYAGYPPHESVPLVPIPGSNGWTSASVTFLAGSPVTLEYKYSARISGTNNYEAICLTDFDKVSRKLTLPTDGTPVTVTEHLGAAAYPLRNRGDTNVPSAQNRLFTDARRGDAGIRTNRTVLFQLDLSMRKRDNVQRVMVLGSDPLRGFNDTGNNAGGTASDYPNNSVYVTWTNAGVQLFDDGTRGDVAAGDGVYSRLWSLTTNGYDAAVATNSPYSLVGGGATVYLPELIPGTQPYLGDTWWLTRRTPRRFIYKFYVLTTGGATHESPSGNLEYYVVDPADASAIVLEPFTWDNEAIPPPPPTNAPVGMAVAATGGTATVQFENVLSEGAHGLLISTNLVSGFQDYGLRATAGATNEGKRQWSASVGQISAVKEYYAPYAGLEPAARPHYWIPNYVPATATPARVYYCQYQTELKGGRALNLAGSFTGWGTAPIPMAFLGDGLWTAEASLPAAASGSYAEYKFRNGDVWMSGGNLSVLRGGNATWDPDVPVPGALLAIQFEALGTPLATASNLEIHLGFDDWKDVTDPAITNVGGTTWSYAFTVPTNYAQEVDFVFRGYVGGSTNPTWFSHGKDWRLYMSTFVTP